MKPQLHKPTPRELRKRKARLETLRQAKAERRAFVLRFKGQDPLDNPITMASGMVAAGSALTHKGEDYD